MGGPVNPSPWERTTWPCDYKPGDRVFWYAPHGQWVPATVIATNPPALSSGEHTTPGLRLRVLTVVAGQKTVAQVDARSRYVQPGRTRKGLLDLPAGSCVVCGETLYADLGTHGGNRLCGQSPQGRGLHEFEPTKPARDRVPAQRGEG